MTNATDRSTATPPAGPPLWAPWYGIGFPAAFGRFFRKYADFTGRAGRAEYWWWVLWAVIIFVPLSIVGSVIDVATGFGADTDPASLQAVTESFRSPSSIISYVFGLVILVPGWALAARRLHDTGRSGWWQLLQLVPIVGGIVLIVWYASASRPDGARYDRPRR
ncbi:DUF805 domain-containing protein [Curtobacterium sp. Leaf261]|uniref:DUF805 domain-containing protein n=1 Tax=Curtobacterium sp. Leaf261 TaxID=1736311 RepID=UPI0006F70EB4|nr:DUF805 domain-containing protein [Curtobacterium sp. Leaf261]KQO63799.1 hypothetical protein ASF23_06220 [Curtobacterium sp. Leaf261]